MNRTFKLPFLALLLLICAAVQSQVVYRAIDLGTLGGKNSQAFGINEHGQVSGTSEVANGNRHAFKWTPASFNGSSGAMHDLGVLDAKSDHSEGRKISSSGLVGGSSFDSKGRETMCLFNGSTVFDETPTAAAALGFGINVNGIVSGHINGSNDAAACIVQSGAVTTIPHPDALIGNHSIAFAVNSAAHVTGQVDTHFPDGNAQAFLFESGQLHVLGTLGGDKSAGNDINDAGLGEIVGGADSKLGHHAFLWPASGTFGNGSLIDLGTLPTGFISEAFGINNKEQVVGTSNYSDGQTVAFLWDRKAAMRDLNDLLDTGSASTFTIQDAQGINDDGEICGTALLSNGLTHAVLLVPFAHSGPIVQRVEPPFANEKPAADLTVTVHGSGFNQSSKVFFGGHLLSTKFVNVTILTAVIPKALLGTAGSFNVTVQNNPGPVTSNARAFGVRTTTITVSIASQQFDKGTNHYILTLNLKNVGNVSAQDVKITGSKLGQAATSNSLPVVVGLIGAGATATRTLSYPFAAGSHFSSVQLLVFGSFTSGAFSCNQSVFLP